MIDVERFSEPARFVRAAVEAGAHFQHPPQLNPKGRTGDQLLDWDRNVDITLTYYFGKFEGKDNNRSFPYDEVKKIFPGEEGPLTRERIRQIVTTTVEKLYSNCPTEVQSQYDLDVLTKQIGKPEFLTSPKGTTRSIADDVEAGQKYQYLSGRYPQGTLSNARRTLAPYGIIVPIPDNKENTNSLTEQFKKVESDTDKKILQQLLGQINQSFMVHHRDIYHKYFVGLTNLLRDLGFHFDVKSGDLSLFLERMEHFDIPFGHTVEVVKDGPQKGEHNYYFVFRTQKEDISQSLLSDAGLADFLLEQNKAKTA